ncbi:hypothetical protein MMC28_000556 [Mycoblastus sanguinarius]|nr:hypothetical protein [Mycoblastus sanguinarius]
MPPAEQLLEKYLTLSINLRDQCTTPDQIATANKSIELCQGQLKIVRDAKEPVQWGEGERCLLCDDLFEDNDDKAWEVAHCCFERVHSECLSNVPVTYRRGDHTTKCGACPPWNRVEGKEEAMLLSHL